MWPFVWKTTTTTNDTAAAEDRSVVKSTTSRSGSSSTGVDVLRSNVTNEDAVVTATTAAAVVVCKNTNNNHETSDSHDVSTHVRHQPLFTTTTYAFEYISTKLHPGHCCMMMGIPLVLHAYYYGYNNYHTSSEQLVQEILQKQQPAPVRPAVAGATTATVVVPTPPTPPTPPVAVVVVVVVVPIPAPALRDAARSSSSSDVALMSDSFFLKKKGTRGSL